MGINALWPPRVKSHRDAASFDLGGESGKKASIHFQCFDPRTFPIPSIYPALSIKDAPRNPRFSFLPLPPSLPLTRDKKDEEEASRRDATRRRNGTKRRILEEPGRNVVNERGTIRASVDWLYRRRAPTSPIGEGLLEGNQADNPINKLVRIYTHIALVVLDLIDRLRCMAHGLMFVRRSASTYFTTTLDSRISGWIIFLMNRLKANNANWATSLFN